MTGKPFPPDLREWVANNLPGLDEVTDVSWPRGSSQVWRVVAGPTAAFVKLSPAALDFDREVVGYACAARILADTATTPPAIRSRADLLTLGEVGG